jgi:hypothetical protein
MDDALAVIDHIASRVTASVLTGLGCGAAYSSYKGAPLVKTSISTAFSFALVSTACFTMERVANIIIKQSSILLPDDVDGQNSTKDSNVDKLSSAATATTNTTLIHYGSHATGGLLGGGIVGFLFQGKPMAGAILLTPMMLIVGKIEASVFYESRRKEVHDESHTSAGLIEESQGINGRVESMLEVSDGYLILQS